MAWRKIDQSTNPTTGIVVTVHHETVYKEYRVRIVGMPQTDYFTDDLLDANNAAKFMLDREILVQM